MNNFGIIAGDRVLERILLPIFIPPLIRGEYKGGEAKALAGPECFRG
jgi:hypothetical protein